MKYVGFLFLSIFIFSSAAFAKAKSILFIGNSYTYLPEQGTPDAPTLPKLIAQIARSIDPNFELIYDFNTPGGYTFEKHVNDPKTQKLISQRYDHVILQGQSIESLELTPEWMKFGIGVQSFSIYLPKLVEIALKNNESLTLFVNWGWNFKNDFLQPGAEGLTFPPGSPRAGEAWCGHDKFEFQNMINDSYRKIASSFPTQLSFVGSSWLDLQNAGLVNEDELYIPDDWSHPSVLGGYVTALVLVRDVLKMDISRSNYAPESINSKFAKAIRIFLANRH